MVDTEVVDHASEQRSLREKHSAEIQNTNGAEQPASDGDDDDSEYPTGLRLIFVVVALILAIFLTSLDFVSSSKALGSPAQLKC